MKLKNVLISGAILAGLSISSGAIAQQKPDITPYTFENGANLNGLSDNGKWAVARARQENTELDTHPYIIDIDNEKVVPILSDEDIKDGLPCGAYDVTNDGKMVVGNYDRQPAYFKDNKWSKLPLPMGYGNIPGNANSVTPDGSCIVGALNYSIGGEDGNQAQPFLWVNNQITACPNLPTKDVKGYDIVQNEFLNISSDGNIILGRFSYSHPGWGCGYYVYNREKQTYNVIGKDMPNNSFVDQAVLSNNGKWVTGMVHYVSGPNFGDSEYKIAFSYDVEKNAFSYFNDTDDMDFNGTAISNTGIVLGCTPAENPIRAFNFRLNNLWYNFEQVLKQRYDMNYVSTTGYDYTGLPISISDDGLTVAAISMATSMGYVVRMKESFTEAADGINLLDNYTFNPSAGATFTYPKQFTITFDKTAELNGDIASSTALYNADGTQFQKALSVTKDNNSDKTFYITFRPRTPLNDGEKYTLRIPAGAFVMKASSSMLSPEINVTYVGRKEGAITPTVISPSDNASVKHIGPANTVNIRFDAPVILSEGAIGNLYQDGNPTPLCDLSFAAQSNLLSAFPIVRQNLQKDINYKVVIPAGTVTDIMGFGANEEITLHYTGIYEPEILADTLLFAEDFQDMTAAYNQFMLYDGDQLTPTKDMESLEFDAINTPWYFMIHDDNGTDNCAGSHSSYTNGGASDDWMITKQLKLNGKNVTLTFDAQSYKKDKTDVLKVMIYESDEAMSQAALTKEFIDKIRQNGEVIYSGVETPGNNEEILANEWTSHRVNLAKYEGKNVYIAFVNENKAQSMVFVDNIKVTTDVTFSATLTTPESVVNQNEMEIAGYIANLSRDMVFDTFQLTLIDENNKEVSKLNLNDQNLNFGERIKFVFNDKLPITVGKENRYSVRIEADNESKTIEASVKNLTFQPNKRVVFEEITGTGCGYCPLGIIALEYLEKTYPENIVPICVHSSALGPDPYEFSDYISALNLGSAMPKARINRSEKLYEPMKSNGESYSFISAEGDDTFMDIFLKEMEQPVDAEINMTNAGYDTDLHKIKVDVEVKYALDMTDLNVGLAFVLLEDELNGRQTNYLSSNPDPILGDWGKGGVYGTSYVRYTYNDIARTAYGNLVSGNTSYVPSQVTGGEVLKYDIEFEMSDNIAKWDNTKLVCMMIDANTGKIINAARKDLISITTGIANNESDKSIGVSTANGLVNIHFAEETQADVTLYTANGMILEHKQIQAGNGESVSVSAKGYTGIAIVQVASGNRIIVRKVNIN